MRRVGVALIPGEIKKTFLGIKKTLMKKDKKDSRFTNAHAWPFGGKVGGGVREEGAPPLPQSSFPYRHGDSHAAKDTRFCTFPYRHGDIHAAKDTMFCSFPYRHGDIHVAKDTRFCSFPYRHGDIHAPKDTRFCSFPYRHRDIHVAKDTRFCSPL